MLLFRLYTGADGKSHVEPIPLAKTPDWGKGLATTQISFRETPAGNFQDWHPAPRRQFVIILSGQLETSHVSSNCPCDNFDERRFARAVFAHECMDFTRAKVAPSGGEMPM